MAKVDIKKSVENIGNTIDTSASISRALSEWRPILAQECQVYVLEESYLAKRFDQINYKFCDRKTAEEILKDNVYALLRFKYFPKSTDEVEDRIKEIVSSFLNNIKTSLIRISFNKDSECQIVSWIPDCCIAFRNGVFDFRNNRWLFKYNKTPIPKLHNTIYEYDPKYIIMWYENFDFEPLPVNITETKFEDFIDIIKRLDEVEKNYCFELMYNMAHDIDDKFNIVRFQHLCEILGYTCNQSFVQAFVLLIGSGQNGKNSLFDGAFSSRVIPAPANNDMDSLETDQFITGALENKSHNFFLETDPETKSKSKMLKAITGSMYQTIQHKGVDKYSGIINCKHLWSANDQEKIKFSDNTVGFRRRINIFETWYRWDENKKFLKKGDYYDTTFSEDLHEIKDDLMSYITYIYFAMYGIMSATNNFTRSFKFHDNDWKMKYSDIDFDLKEKVDAVNLDRIRRWINANNSNYEDGKTLFFASDGKRIYQSNSLIELGYNNYDEFAKKFLDDEEAFMKYFVDNDAYISIRHLQVIMGVMNQDAANFTQNIKKIYNVQTSRSLYNNKPYVKCTFINNRLKILSE